VRTGELVIPHGADDRELARLRRLKQEVDYAFASAVQSAEKCTAMATTIDEMIDALERRDSEGAS
jgi:hypothetical protein